MTAASSDSGNARPIASASASGLGTRRRGRAIAVTGANTFLGKNLIGLLEEDPRVGRIVVIDIKNPPSAGSKTSFYDVDLTQPAVESRIAEILHAEAVDTLAHLAFSESPTQATAWAHELESVGTMHVLSACRQRRLRKLVVAGTTLVYGPHPDHPNFLDESRPARGLRGAHFVADKLDVEAQLRKLIEAEPQTRVTLLRMAPIIGPTVNNYVARWLTRTFVPTVLGHDPLARLLHEVDALAALKLALERDVAGVFNIASRGVLPISTVIKLVGGLAVPLPYAILQRASALLWVAQLSEAPPPFLAFLRYLCVPDTTRAERELGFTASYTTRDAVLDFEGALRLRQARLLTQTT